MANTFKETLRTFRAVNKHFGFRARVAAPEQSPSVSVSTAAAPVGVLTPTEKQGEYLFIPVAKTSAPVEAEMEFYDAIGSDFFGDGITAKTVSTAMKDVEAAGAKTLNIRINSPGGDVFEATAIYNILDRFKGKKNVYIDGLAASAASYIAMVGDTITTAPNAMWMVHDPWGFAVGNAADMRTTADVLDKVGSTLLGTYVTRNRKALSDNEMRSIMANETWMTAEEALAKGFTDSISKSDDEPDPMDPDEMDEPPEEEQKRAARAVAVLSTFKNVPEKLRPDTRARLASMEARASPRSGTSTEPVKK